MRRLSALVLVTLALLSTWALSAWAFEPFVVKDIRLEGLQRISAGTVFNYLPIKVGERVDAAKTADAIRALYKTGFFKDVRIDRQNDTLVVIVQERPSIASITFKGNKSVDTKDLEKSLKQVGFAVGRPFNRSIFEQVEQELRRTYFNLGKYGVKIKSTVTPLERNRVGVNFDITEGRVATIADINIVGNHAFDTGTLLDQFNLTTSKWYLFFSSSDQYSREKLAGDLERLRSFYLDRGYINFNIDSTQVSVTPDKKHVYITVNISEGKQYKVSDVKLAGKLIVPQKELFKLVKISRGQVFSQADVTETSKAITDRLGEDGYAFANVNAIPDIDKKNDTVALTFFVDPGKRVYVQRINFSGNTKTRDVVLRREMRQMEGGWIDTQAIKRSKERLQRLGYFESVNVQTPPVPGTADQVDVDFNVTEKPSGSLLAGVGFSQTQGIVFNTSIKQDNFLGTGNQVGFTFNNSSVNRAFALSYLNPYWTIDGISRGFDARYETTNAADANIASYTLDELSGGVTFGVPISEYNTVNFSARVKQTKFKTGYNPSNEVLAFQSRYGNKFNDVVLGTSFARDSRDSLIFPTKGHLDQFGAQIAAGDLNYYKLTYEHQQFFPLSANYTLALDGNLGYGNGFAGTGELPLISNFYAGGIRSVRGFKDNTLGPRDSQNQPLGGNFKLVGSAAVILPVPFVTNVKNLRLTAFVDTGNVYGPGENIDLGQLRVSSGVAVSWLSPFGALTLSAALPVVKKSGDETQPLQFLFGTAF